MKIFGLDFWIEVFQAFTRVLRRFPLSVLSGLLAAIAFSIVVKQGIHDEPLLQERCLRWGLTGILGISYFVLVELICERLGGRFKPGGLVVTAASVFLLILFGLWIPFEGGENIYDRFWTLYLMIGVVAHLGIAVVPFWKLENADQTLWEYNKVLLSKFLITGFFSAVSFAGMALALVSINLLFDADIEEEAFARIWFFCAFVLNTCLLLGNLPEAGERSQLQLDYPKWILFLSKYIFLPLVILYFGILYVYAGKILVTWTWPEGMVGLPVLVLAAVGGLTALLVWPLSRQSTDSMWARKFWRFFFPLFLPLAVLLLMALQRRISDYGFTEIRYVGLMLGFWILGISAYYSFRPRASFKVVPWSLIGLALPLLLGPLSPASVAKRSQWSRLQTFLVEHDALQGGTLVPNAQEVDGNDFQSFRSILRYLAYGYGPDVFQPILEGISPEKRVNKLGVSWDELYRNSFVNALVEYSGITSAQLPNNSRLILNFERNEPVVMGNYEAFYHARSAVSRDDGFLSFTVHGQIVKARKVRNESLIRFVDETEQELAVLDLAAWLEEQDLSRLNLIGGANQYLGQEALSIEVDLKSIGTIQLVARNLNFSKRGGEWYFQSGEFWFLVPRS